jgi:hypothetical protein
MNKPPITVLEELQRDLTCSPLVSMQCLLDFAKHDLERIILDLYEERSVDKARISMLEAELKLDGFNQLELVAEYEKGDAA